MVALCGRQLVIQHTNIEKNQLSQFNLLSIFLFICYQQFILIFLLLFTQFKEFKFHFGSIQSIYYFIFLRNIRTVY